MKAMVSRTPRKHLLEIPRLMAMVAVTIAGLISLPAGRDRTIALLLLAVFAAIMFTPFFWHGRRVRVHVGLGILSAVVAGLLVLSPGWSFFPILFFLLAPTAMVELPIRDGWIWISIFSLITAGVFFAIVGLLGLALALPYAAGYAFFGFFGWMTVEADRNRERSEQLLAELQAAHRQLQDYAARVEELTISQERNRMAREMHDTLGHRLTIAAVQLEGAQRLIPSNPERSTAIIGTVREQIKEGLTDLRRTVAMLRASVDEDLPLDKALTRLVDQVRQATAVQIHLSLEDCPQELSLPQHQALYRAAQEGLTNIQRHAHASEAWVRLFAKEGRIHLLISDNGVGFSPDSARTGFGLVGLTERAALQGGEFHIDPRPGGGTQITFKIPLVNEAQPPVELPSGGTHE